MLERGEPFSHGPGDGGWCGGNTVNWLEPPWRSIGARPRLLLMVKGRKTLAWLFKLAGWVATLAPNWWAAVTASAGGAFLFLVAAGERIFSSAVAVETVFIFALFLWIYIGLIWLSEKKARDQKTFRYGLTFEGVVPIFMPHNKDGALLFALMVRNFSPFPIRYYVEEFYVQIDTRVLPSLYEKNSLHGILARGAGRMSSAIPFQLEHIKEYIDKKVDGTIKFSIIYGDADKKPVRRLKMSIDLFLKLPKIDGYDVENKFSQIGFTANIKEESDEPID